VGSGTGAKWLMMILVYFALMTFIVGLVNMTMETDVGSEADTTGTYCGGPREIYEPYNPDPLEQEEIGWIMEKYYSAHIDCSKSAGILGQDVCEEIEGCEWGTSSGWFGSLFGSSDDTCIGTFNHSFLENNTVNIGILGLGVAEYNLTDDEESNFICTHPDVYDNQTLCEEFSCTFKYRESISDFEGDDIRPRLGLLGSIWDVTKDMVSFQFDFGFDESSLNFILNFLLFWLPLIGVGLSIYVMLRT